jgi:hypothetical protein
MSVTFDGVPLAARLGAMLRVLVIARISTVHQDERSLADQIALCEKYVRDRYAGPVEFRVIQSRGSGEYLAGAELAQAEALIQSGEIDLVVVEDLGRICRRLHATLVCEMCEDAGTRLIAINDSLDTGREDWRMNALFASFKYESYNIETSNRIRRTLRNRFEQGGVVQTLPYGYCKPPGAKSDAEISKAPAAERVYERWFALLEGGAGYAEVADWLNSEGVPVGQWNKNEKWDGHMVRRVTHNPILKGYRRRNDRVAQRVNKTGKRRSVKAPPGERLLRHAPHLQFIEPERYDRLIADLAERYGHYARGRKAGTADPRAGLPRTRTVWPGQHVVCGVCGGKYYWGGHGQQGHLMCSGARAYVCWNSASFAGADAAQRFVAAALATAKSLPEVDAADLARAEAEGEAQAAARAEAVAKLEPDIRQAEREVANLADAVARTGYSAALQAKLAEVETRLALLVAERADLARPRAAAGELPTAEDVRAKASEALAKPDFCDPEFGRLLHRLIPKLEVFPHRSIDGGRVVLRARMEVRFGALFPALPDEAAPLLTRVLVVDLFDPPQPVACRERVVALRAAGVTQREAAGDLGITTTAAQRAMVLHRKMTELGLTDPYQALEAPPEGDSKFRRHKHARYCFAPKPGYPAWPASA